MLLEELYLRESSLPDEASIQRRFDFASVDNRRFIYDPVARRFVIGHLMRKSRTLEGSHAEEWFDATGSNRNFDRCVRGWFGTGGNYRNGIIHFAPPADVIGDDRAYQCLKAFVACGATAKTKLRGYPSMDEAMMGKVVPDLFKTAAGRPADHQPIPSAS